ncbi:MAG: DUF983 domain-containing protein [Cyclobacteriaceae bacterium]
MSERKALSAVLEGKCPQCREGDMFKYSLWRFGKFNAIHTNCEKCNLRFEREPGFFYGAMYVSYALSVALFITAVGLLYFVFDDPSLTTYVVSISLVSILFYPITFRYSRILFMYGFGGVKFKPLKDN